MIGTILRYRYELIEKAGDGFLFTVYRARDRVQNRVVALKLLHTQFHGNARLVDALRQAAFTTARISNPCAARVYEFDEDEGAPFLLVEFARGASLKTRIRRVAPFSVPVAIDNAIGIAEGVDAAHRAGVVHADLCPQNVIVGMEGHVKVTDFGLSPVYTASPESLAMYVGRAAAYLPAEVSRGEPPGVATDVYSLGVVLYEMLTGDLPFSGDTPVAMAMQHAQKSLPALRVLNPAVPVTVEQMALKATQKDPELRYTTMAEFVYDLKAVRDALRFGRPLSWSPMDSRRPEVVSSPLPTATAPPIVIPTPVAPVESAPVIEETPVPLPETRQAEPPPPKRKEAQPVVAAPKPPPERPRNEGFYENAGVPMWLKVIWGLLLATVLVGIFVFAAVLFSNWTAPRDIFTPSLVGKTRTDAKKQLDALNLKMEVERTDYSEKFPPDTIYFMTPAAGKPLKAGSAVRVWLSRGSPTVRVPDVRGMTEEEAQKTLEAVDLGVTSKSRRQASDVVPYNNVIQQDPSAGTKVDRGRLVQLTVSNGPSLEDNFEVNTEVERQRAFEVDLTLPPGDTDVQVKIEVEDANGVRVAWEDIRPPGDHIVQQLSGIGDRITVRVYADGKLVKQMVFNR